MLQDPDSGVRQVALDTLADIEDKESAPWVASLLSDESSRVRREAINTLARLGAQDAAPQIASLLGDADVGCGIHYPVPIHLQEAYADMGLGEGSFPTAERSASECVSLPMFPELTQEQIKEVVNQIGLFQKSEES